MKSGLQINIRLIILLLQFSHDGKNMIHVLHYQQEAMNTTTNLANSLIMICWLFPCHLVRTKNGGKLLRFPVCQLYFPMLNTPTRWAHSCVPGLGREDRRCRHPTCPLTNPETLQSTLTAALTKFFIPCGFSTLTIGLCDWPSRHDIWFSKRLFSLMGCCIFILASPVVSNSPA